MGMSSRVKGVRDLDGEFAKMMAVKVACDAVEIDYPEAVKAYFKYPGESADYLRCEMESVDISAAVTESQHDAIDRFEVDLSKLPKGVKAIRFENSY